MATQMKAPPSTKKEIVDVPFNYRSYVERYSPGGRYVDAQTDVDSPWVPFGENAAIKHLLFDTRHNHIERNRVQPTLGNDHIGIAFRWLNKF